MRPLFCLLMMVVFWIQQDCKADAANLEVDAMSRSERDFNLGQRDDLVIAMPIEVMFPDKIVRILSEAAGTGKLDVIEALVDRVDVNSRGKQGATPLFWALRSGNLSGFTKLLKLGADPNIEFADSSIMHWAAQHENVSFLRVALTHGGDPNLATGQFGETPIFNTIGVTGYERREHRELLLRSGADINAKTRGMLFGRPIGGKTPVMAAADLGRFDIVYELLTEGADFATTDVHGRNLADQVSRNIGAFVPGSPYEVDLERVAEWLSQRGVMIREHR